MAFQLSVLFRCLLEAAALVGVCFAAWRFVWKPAQEDATHEDLARRLEAEYPDLSEQLFTLVSLRHDAEIANGSPQLVNALARDTNHRTADLDFNRPFPIKPVARFGVLASVVLVASIAIGVALPGERLRRAAPPWHRSSASAPFDIVVTSGDSVVRRGDPVTLAAYLKPALRALLCRMPPHS